MSVAKRVADEMDGESHTKRQVTLLTFFSATWATGWVLDPF